MTSSAFEALCFELRGILLAQRQRIAEEIARHPRPITGCDVHFNRLLEERALVAAELDRFDDFLSASMLLTPVSKEKLRSAQSVSVPDLLTWR